MIKLLTSVEPPTRNSHKSNFDQEKHRKPVIPHTLSIKIVPLGTIMKHWDNFDDTLYTRLSLLRANLEIKK
jgi:hypothetical protein